MLDLCVLARLARGESYGYELAQWLEASGFGVIHGGTLYPVLLRLQRNDLVVAQWREGESGPARKYYWITPQGLDAVREAAVEWRAFASGVDAALSEGAQW
nr:PadR family transcriptional regulator [Micromonospora sp. DSM 115978]